MTQIKGFTSKKIATRRYNEKVKSRTMEEGDLILKQVVMQSLKFLFEYDTSCRSGIQARKS